MSRIHFEKRREFLKGAACLAASGAASTFVPQLSMMGTALAQSVGSSYKALVCIYLDGGNDSWNVAIPADLDRHNEYVAARGGIYAGNPAALGIPLSGGGGTSMQNALPLNNGNPVNDGRRYAVNPAVPALRDLFNQGRLSFVANVGPLVVPVRRSTFGTTARPPQLYSHNDQTSLWQIGDGRNATNPNGWGGMLAGQLLGTPPPSTAVPPCISITGQTRFLVGEYPSGAAVFPYRLSTNAILANPPATSLTNYGTGDTAGNKRREVLRNLLDETYPQAMSREYGDIVDRSLTLSESINTAILNIPATLAAFNTAVNAIPNSGLGRQLQQVARVIAVSRFGSGPLPANRQIFFVRTGGYDTHDGQFNGGGSPAANGTWGGHQGLIQQVAAAMSAFYTAIDVLNGLGNYSGVRNEVVSFTMSEFSRTINSNGNGTDHAWGALQMVMGAPAAQGGPLNGGAMYGRYPYQILGRRYSTSGTPTGTDLLGGECFNRGEFLPTTGTDQMCATFARWMGLADGAIPDVFPNLDNLISGSNANAFALASNTRTLPFLNFT
jgi:uncharacterized protein (DUF1501 family)